MRASDADREQAVRTITEAMNEGRLSPFEMDDRVRQVYAAVTVHDLEQLTSDVPKAAAELAPAPSRTVAAPRPRSSVGTLFGFRRGGRWTVPERHTAWTVFGGGRLDLSEAEFDARETTITVVCVLGGLHIVVPANATVLTNTRSFIGAKGDSASGAGDPDGPVIRIVGINVFGGVSIERAAPIRDS